MTGYRSHRRRHGYSGRSDSVGRERALQHIEDARRLSAELGGTDQDVKQYLFSLPPSRLAKILQLYGERFGTEAGEYATNAIPKWRSGAVKMSGTVAERLYSLLPPLMPLSDKYQLTESLWRHVGPATHKVLKIGTDANPDEIITVVRNHAAQTVQAYYIDEGLAKRFNWLAAGDVHVRQQLLNHLLGLEVKLAEDGIRTELPVLIGHIQQHSTVTTHLKRSIQVGKHVIDLEFTGQPTGLSLEEPTIRTWVSGGTSGSNGGGVYIIIIVIAVIVAIAIFN